jgi:hypothetical protein
MDGYVALDRAIALVTDRGRRSQTNRFVLKLVGIRLRRQYRRVRSPVAEHPASELASRLSGSCPRGGARVMADNYYRERLPRDFGVKWSGSGFQEG